MLALAAAHALLFLAAFPPINLWPAAFLAPAPLALLAISARSTRQTLLLVFLTQLALWLWLCRWTAPISALGYPGFVLCLSLYPVLYAWVIRRVGRHPRIGRWPMTLLVPLTWVALECLRGKLVFHGYPWFLLAHPLIEWHPLVQSADLLGTYFLSALAAAVSGLIVDIVRAKVRRESARRVLPAALLVIVLHAANLAYGLWRINQTDILRPGPHVLVIQTNLPQSNKIAWSIDEQVSDVASFIRLTREAHEQTEAAADLIVWPETMLPVRGLEPETLETLQRYGQDVQVAFADAVMRLNELLDTPLLIGSPCYLGLRVDEIEGGYQWAWDRNYNSAYLVTGAPPLQRYDKTFLTPFGEVMPYISAWPWLERQLLALGARGMEFTLDANPNPVLIELDFSGGTAHLATPICFEDTMARVCRRMIHPAGAKVGDLIVNLSNDGWFGSCDAGRAQHVQAARFRCVENRVPMVRAANTGLSVWIDSTGGVVGTIGPGRYGEAQQPGYLPAYVRLDARRSLYGRIGDLFCWCCLLLSVPLVLATSLSRQAKEADS